MPRRSAMPNEGTPCSSPGMNETAASDNGLPSSVTLPVTEKCSTSPQPETTRTEPETADPRPGANRNTWRDGFPVNFDIARRLRKRPRKRRQVAVLQENLACFRLSRSGPAPDGPENAGMAGIRGLVIRRRETGWAVGCCGSTEPCAGGRLPTNGSPPTSCADASPATGNPPARGAAIRQLNPLEEVQPAPRGNLGAEVRPERFPDARPDTRPLPPNARRR